MNRYLNTIARRSASGRRSAAAKKWPRTRLGLERLERRDVPTTSLIDGVLTVTGTENADTIELSTHAVNGVTFTRVLNNGTVEFDNAGIINRIDVDGLGGSDAVVLRGIQSRVAGRANVFNAEDVTVGDQNAAGRFSLGNILSQVRVFGVSDGRLAIRNDADATDKTVVVTANMVRGLAPVDVLYNLVGGARSRLTLATGDGDDVVTVGSTPTVGPEGVVVATNGGEDLFILEANTSVLRFQGGDQDDTFVLGPDANDLRGLDRQVLIAGGGGTNALVIDDGGRGLFASTYDATFDVAPQGGTLVVTHETPVLEETDTVSIGFSGVQSVGFTAPGLTGANRVHVRATPSGVATVINSGGASRVDIGDNGSLDRIQGAVTVYRATAGGLIVLDDSAETDAKLYTLQANSVDRTNAARISFDDDTSEVRVLAGSGGDTFVVGALRGGTARYRLNGGDGNDELRAPNTANQWELLGIRDSGQLNFRVSYDRVENLYGGTADDHFRLSNDQGVSGSINGDPLVNGTPIPGGGFDTIDYSGYAVPVTVNLAAGTGTNIGGGAAGRLTGFDVVFGGQVDDVLTGDNGANVLVGNAGNDSIIGGGGRDILIGGDGADDLSNRDGNPRTIYLPGITSNFVSTPGSLKALRAEWTRTDNTDADRRANIINGGGLNGNIRLNSSTIFNDGDADTVRAGTGVDLIYLEVGDLLDGNQPEGEIFNL